MAIDLRACIDDALAGIKVATLRRSVDQLMARYQSGEAATSTILSDADAVRAYTAYRMPATHAVAVAVLTEVRDVVPTFEPHKLADFGAGTGAVAWAAVQTWPELNQLELLEQSASAIALGKQLARASRQPPLQDAVWRQWQVQTEASTTASDIATAAYVLGELTSTQQADLVATMTKTAPVVVLIEPGTPAGFNRIVTARDTLIAGGFTIVAPCPHDHECPMLARRDWCHFAERLDRSAKHRALKDGELSYEDEKYSYVVAARVGDVEAHRPEARILRHPKQRKGLVTFELCTAEGTAIDAAVAKSQGAPYKAARDARWGDGWPPSVVPNDA
jgi:ribosomal protein RSM22 (predicted rRNA methylase)